MNQEEKIQTEYEEIDLMDYVKVILHRKWLILGIFFGAVIIAGILSWYLPKVYKIDTFLEVGKITGEVIEVPGHVVEKINGDVYGNTVKGKLNISEENWPKITVENQKDTNLIIMEIDSTKPQQAKNILEVMNDLILTEHQEKIKSKKELLENNIKLLENDIEISKKDIERVKIKISSLEEERKNLEAKVDTLQKILPFQQDLGTQFALFDAKEKLEQKRQEIEDRYLEINSLENQTNSLQNQINTLRDQIDNIINTAVIKVPTISTRPIRPRLVLNVIIAGILAIFIGVFLAFFQEWWEKNKGRI